MLVTARRLFTLHATTIGERFRHRIAEWQLAGAITAAGFILLRPGETFLLPPYADMREMASEDAWAWMFLSVGLARFAALVVNGAMQVSTSVLRAALAGTCALFWAFLLWGFLKMDTPTLMVGMLGGAFITEFVNIYRIASDARNARDDGADGRFG